MKFKFCGENDCPDWILAQINVISKLTSIKLKLILNSIINHIKKSNLNLNLFTETELELLNYVCKLTLDAKLSEEETKAVIAALHYIITSSIKYNTDGEIVSNELQQLGLPREHSIVLSKIYSENFDELKSIIKERYLKINSLNNYSHEIKSTFEDENGSIHCPSMILKLKGSDHGRPMSKTFHLRPELLNAMINDLKEVAQLMESNK